MINISNICSSLILILALSLTSGCDKAEELKQSTFDIMDQTMEKAREQIDQVKEKVEQFKGPAPDTTGNETPTENLDPNSTNENVTEE